MSYADRRSVERLALERLGLVVLQAQSGEQFICLLENISVKGMMLEHFVTPREAAIQIGDEFLIMDCPESMADALAQQKARVVWELEDLFGLEFEHSLPFSQDHLEAALEQASMLRWEHRWDQ